MKAPREENNKDEDESPKERKRNHRGLPDEKVMNLKAI